jgi:hypothetical protein
MLGPHLTEANLAEVLARAKHRTKREISALVRVLDPLPAVPARIEPLGPAPARLVPSAPTWEEFVGARCPVRELAPGERRRDWADAANEAAMSAEHGYECETLSGARSTLAALARAARVGAETTGETAPGRGETAPARLARFGAEPTGGTTPEHSGGVAGELPGPQRYKVQFTATEEYVKLIDEAKALLSHAVKNATIEDIQLQALRAFVASLKKQKYAVMKSSRAFSGEPSEPSESALDAESISDATVFGVEYEPRAKHPRRRRRRGRHIPAAVRRAVFERDGGRCSYVDATGRRCAETHRLEFHHLTPFARNGTHAPSNLTLRCAPHNALAAEEDFGTEFILERKSTRHEAFSAITAADP